MTRAVVTLGFLMAFAAGLAVGLKFHRPEPSATTRPSRHGGWLAAELNLTPTQQEQLNQIWRETASPGGPDGADRRRQLYREREEDIAALIRPEDKAKYDEILKSYGENSAALDKEWRGAFQRSVERTKAILTPAQRAKYEEMLKRHEPDRGPRDRWRGEREPGRKGGERPSSKPASSPSGGL